MVKKTERKKQRGKIRRDDGDGFEALNETSVYSGKDASFVRENLHLELA